MFFKKSKKVKLTFHTCEQRPFKELFAPVHAISATPSWWKDIPRQDFPTMRSCPGFIEFFKHAIGIPLWRDHEITYQGDQILDLHIAGVGEEMLYHHIHYHDPRQWGNAFSDRPHLKFMNPWLITADKSVDFVVMDATWHNKNPEDLIIPPGIANFKYQSGAHVNAFLGKSTEVKTLNLEAGNIISYLVPLEDVDIEIETKQVSTDEWRQLLSYQWSFSNVYNKTKKFLEGKRK